MKRIFLTLLILFSTYQFAQAATQTRIPTVIGAILPSFSSSANVTTLNNANSWIAFAFTQVEAKTLNAVMITTSAVTGTLTQLQADIYSDSAAGIPNASLASKTTVTTLPTTGNVPLYTEFTGFSYALTAGTRYWIVFRNNTATPASNFPTIRYLGNSAEAIPASDGTIWGSTVVQTANAGTAWTTNLSSEATGLRLQYSDGSYDGFPTTNSSLLNSTGTYANGNNEIGVYFTANWPANVSLNVRGIGMYVAKVGSPTGNARFKLYTGTTLIDTTAVIPPGNITGGRFTSAYFPTVHAITGQQVLRVVIGDSNSGDSTSNGFTVNAITVDTSAASLALLPFNGTLQKTYWNGSSWAQDNSLIIAFGLILDTTGEHSSTGNTTTTINIFGDQ